MSVTTQRRSARYYSHDGSAAAQDMSVTTAAPKARNMTARGKCEAKRARRPWKKSKPASSPERAKYDVYLFRPFRPQRLWGVRNKGRRARFASRLPLAVIFRAFGA